MFALARLFKAGHQFAERELQLLNLGLILIDVRGDFGRTLDGLVEVPGLPLTQVMRMFNSLFKPCYFRTGFVKTRLYLVERIAAFALLCATTFQLGFKFALLGNRPLQGRFLFG